MSIDLNWEALTTGPDGEELAASIRDFIHTKFQAVPLPRFIKSVNVHHFELGSTPPELELKDITDPLPDFYEEDPDADYDDEDDEDEDGEEDYPPSNAQGQGHARGHSNSYAHDPGAPSPYSQGRNAVDIASMPAEMRAAEWRQRAQGRPVKHPHYLPPHMYTAGLRDSPPPQDLGSPFLGVSTPGIPGGTSSLNYFHHHLASGLSGTQTPLAAVAGAHLGNWPEASAAYQPHSPLEIPRQPSEIDENRGGRHSRHASQGSISVGDLANSSGVGAGLTPALNSLASASNNPSRSPAQEAPGSRVPRSGTGDNEGRGVSSTREKDREESSKPEQGRVREPRPEDIQAVFRIRYAGDVKLLLTADILLDYPMPSFVGIPVQLSITGLTFDGVCVVAHIRNRVHFCFLSPEDAMIAVGAGENDEAAKAGATPPQAGQQQGMGPRTDESTAGGGRLGGLLQEIRVESEIGQREGGKQSLKNVGKVERFVLAQVRRIFEEEFVYPSFWTFLV